MAVYTDKEAFPPIALIAGMKIRVEAIHPTTGEQVADVTADRWSIYGEDLSDTLPIAQEMPPWVPDEEGSGG